MMITKIGRKYRQVVGDTPKASAGERARIIKKNIPVVIGEATTETAEVFKRVAGNMNAPIYFAKDHFSIVDYHNKIHSLEVEVSKKNYQDHFKFELDLPGLYQLKNALTVLQATSILHSAGWNLDQEVVHSALKQVKKRTGLHGRWDVIREKPLVVLDVAHNEDGIRMILQQLEIIAATRVHFILGMVKDKAIQPILELLPTTAHYYFTQANIPRALEKNQLQKMAATVNLNGDVYPDVNAALREALNHAADDDIIIVCGSVFLIAEITRT